MQNFVRTGALVVEIFALETRSPALSFLGARALSKKKLNFFGAYGLLLRALAGPRVALERLATGGSALRYQADTNGGYLSLAVVTR